MAVKPSFHGRPHCFRSAITFLFLLLSPEIFAQAPADGNSYFIDTSTGSEVFIQRLSWYPEEYALRYEIVIEAVLPGTGSYREFIRESTEEDYIDLNLPPGLYRYRVQAYDLFEKPAGNPPWIALEVIPALKPELFSTEPAAVYHSGNGISFLVKGRNLVNGAAITLINRANGREAKGTLETELNGEEARAVFASSPGAGIYDITIENPGGLSNTLGPFTILSPTPPETGSYLSLGYTPMIPLHGQINTMLDAAFYPLGLDVRLWTTRLKWGMFNFGFEGAAVYNYINSSYSQDSLNYDVSGHFAGLSLNLLVQAEISDQLSIRLSGGGGIATAVNFKKQASGLSAEAVNVLYPSVNAGIAALWFFSKNGYFAILGLDYLYLFSTDESNPGFMFPSIGIGKKL
jgi:hypothetical protein